MASVTPSAGGGDRGLDPDPRAGPGSDSEGWTRIRGLDPDPRAGPGSEGWTRIRGLDPDPWAGPGSERPDQIEWSNINIQFIYIFDLVLASSMGGP